MKTTRLLAMVMMLLAFGLMAAGVSAQGNDVQLQETSVTIAPGESEEISFQGFCLEFGEPFPEAFGTINGRASDEVLQVIKTALVEGTAESNPLELNLAIWSVEEGRELTDLYPDLDADIETAAQALIDTGANATVDPLAEDLGTSLDQAVAEGLVEVTSADFTFVDAPVAAEGDLPYHGEGTMVIENISTEEVTIYYPYGLILEATDEAQQDLVTYATELEQQVQPTATPAATATVAATSTAAPTVEATATATAPLMPQTGADDGFNPLVLIALGALMLVGGLVVARVQPRRS